MRVDIAPEGDEADYQFLQTFFWGAGKTMHISAATKVHTIIHIQLLTYGGMK